MVPVKPTFNNWKQFADGREVVTVRFGANDVYEKNAIYPTHRDYITALFKENGVEVTRYAHTYAGGDPKYPMVTEWGLMFTTMESRLIQTDELYEIHAIIGVNARYTKEIVVGEAAGNEVQGKGLITSQ